MREFLLSPQTLTWLAILSAVMFVGSLILMPLLVARMREDYFVAPHPRPTRGRRGVLRYGVLALKNLIGLVLLLAGISMLALPGQGIITILVALSLLNFPGKRRLELMIVRQRHVRQAIRWIRARANRPPLILPDR